MSEETQPQLEPSDAALISAVRKGDQHAFGVLFTRHHDAALALATKITRGTRLSAEDCVADAFELTLKALRKKRGPDEFFRAYLYTVIRNAVQAHKIADTKSVTVDDFEAIENAAGFAANTAAAGNLDPAVTRFEAGVVTTAFSSLDPRWQSVLWYLDVEAMTPTQVAPLLGLTPQGVSMLRIRAREGLRTAYLQAHIQAVEPGSDCEKASRNLGALSRKVLALGQTKRTKAHLTNCADCSAMFEEVNEVNRGLLAIIAFFIAGVSASELAANNQPSPASGANLAAGTTGAAGSTTLSATAVDTTDKIAGVGLGAALIGFSLIASASAAALVGMTVGWGGPFGDQEAPGVSVSQTDTDTDTEEPPTIVPRTDADTDTTAEAHDPQPDGNLVEPCFDPSPILTPVDPVDPNPVDPDPVNLLSNGSFDAAGYELNFGQYVTGDMFGPWLIGAVSPDQPGAMTLQIWSEALGEPAATFAAPFDDGPWARLIGTISQDVATVPGTVYTLQYQVRASGVGEGHWLLGWGGGGTGDALIDGVVVDSFTTAATPTIELRSVTFTATSTVTSLSFVNTNLGPVGLDEVSITEL